MGVPEFVVGKRRFDGCPGVRRPGVRRSSHGVRNLMGVPEFVWQFDGCPGVRRSSGVPEFVLPNGSSLR